MANYYSQLSETHSRYFPNLADVEHFDEEIERLQRSHNVKELPYPSDSLDELDDDCLSDSSDTSA